MKIDLTNKYVLVCGASKGIGRSIALQLGKCGANVVLAARNLKDLQNVYNMLPETGKHLYISVDLQNPQNAVEIIKSQLPSPDCIDILINNTGGPAPGNLLKSEISDFNNAFERHLIASQLLAQFVTSGMISRNWGRIINIISISVRQPVNNLGVSNTIRGAMASWAKTLSSELGEYGITVNSILPGFTATERLHYLIENIAMNNNTSIEIVENDMLAQIPTGRFVQPDEISYLAAFLSSNYAASVTGTVIPVDGGYLRTI